MTSPRWSDFLDAWYQRFRLPPTQAQAETLWDAVDAWPQAVASFVLDCPADMKAAVVVATVLDRFHAIRDDAMAEAAQAEVQADARKRAEALPRNGTRSAPTALAAILDDLPM